jgi:diadenosine tetraphosphate (Ap4A) HIT family hydrolase
VPLYYLGNARTERQLADMVELATSGSCLFCPDQLAADPDQPILHRTPHWTVTPNEFPYAGTALHLLLVPDEHVTDLLDLSVPAQADFWAALGWVRERYALTYYGLGSRNGDCRYTGGTIYHVHVHVIVGDVADPGHQPVRLKLSSRPADPT